MNSERCCKEHILTVTGDTSENLRNSLNYEQGVDCLGLWLVLLIYFDVCVCVYTSFS